MICWFWYDLPQKWYVILKQQNSLYVVSHVVWYPCWVLWYPPWSINTLTRYFWNWIHLSGFLLLKYGTVTLYVGDTTFPGTMYHLKVYTRCFPLVFNFGQSNRIGGSVINKRFKDIGSGNFMFEFIDLQFR